MSIDSPRKIALDAAARDAGYLVGDRWRNPRGRVYRILRFWNDGEAVVLDEKSGQEDNAYYLLMCPTNGWTKL
jgi:hypothetical protein